MFLLNAILLMTAMVPVPSRTAIAGSRARFPLPASVNRIVNLDVSCDSERLNATITMERPFKGLLFARDFAQDCKFYGNMSSTISVSLPAEGCGLRLAAAARSASDGDGGWPRLFYTVTLVAQQDRRLRQAHDQENLLRCPLPDGAFLVKSANMLKALRASAAKDATPKPVNHRVGRMKDEGWSKEYTPEEIEEQLKEAMSSARAWMEISPEKEDDRFDGTVQVGEAAVLTIKSTLPAGIGWRVGECWAHDGLRADGGGGRQRLLDEKGCPAEEGLLPAPRYAPARAVARMRHQTASARFAAFKFPDRDRLHLACSLQLCRGTCPKTNCNNPEEIENRIGRAKKGIPGEILDKFDVFNSVEVLAPEIDDLKKNAPPRGKLTRLFEVNDK